MSFTYTWRGDFENDDVNALHAEAFEHEVYASGDWDWNALVARHSLGWVTARIDRSLVGFVNVVWDGLVHAWVQDTMVATSHRGRGIGTRLVETAGTHARDAGCEWLHVDFDGGLKPFYLDACGFSATNAGLIELA